MTLEINDTKDMLRAVQHICGSFPDDYWSRLDADGAYPQEFVDELTRAGWLSILIPEEYGGGGLGMTEASLILEEINKSGANAAACHAQMYVMGTLLRHGSATQRSHWLPKIAAGETRLQAFAVTEPDAGSDTTRISTTARRDGSSWVLSGQKTFISRVEQSDLMLVLARTRPYDAGRRSHGLSVFLVDIAGARGTLHWTKIPLMFNHHSYTVYFDDVRLPEEALVGQQDNGFRYILDGMNAERILVASEAIGDGRYFIGRAAEYASQRETFGKTLASNQGVSFPLAHAYASVEAASLARNQAAEAFDRGESPGSHANIAKLLASEASGEAARAAVRAVGGMAFSVEFGMERKLREAQLLEIAPVSNNLVLSYLAHNVLHLPRSF
ncbi:acyl-CoA dehydrogenase [Kribbella turkmenica]|uniref:Acyl-CoA dehydrogenase n=2 Tax=Kribbella turkmenica TaxID=2530375 RepID=A0A4R4XBU1_9ACTN|nr:acyl-CoA dehydrogenase [Kribbella turkmenica]